MIPSKCLVALLVLSANGFAEGKSRIVLHTLRSLVTARIDPLISPGKISQHVHHVVGGSNFGPDYDPDKLRQSKCTNLNVQADKSAYWAPQVLRVLNNGSYLAMSTNTRIYYSTIPGVKVEPFPYNFRMMAGNPSRKSVNTSDQGNILTFYYCGNYDKNGKEYGSESYNLPTKSCAILVAKVFFPTCWNGKPFSAKNPTAHVHYPLFGGGHLGANCPSGFPRRIPSILLEVYYFAADQPASTARYQYVLSNGDTTGYGLHADFANGWDQNVLTNMLNNCRTVPVEEPPNQACAALAPSYNQKLADACTYTGKIPNESIGFRKSIPRLPGCNLPWATSSKPVCTAAQYSGDPAWVTPRPGSILWP